MKAHILFAAILFPILARADEQIAVGDQKLTIPGIDGFSRYDGINAQADAAMQKSLPASKRFLMCLVPNEAAATAKAGKQPKFDCYMQIETMRAIESSGITAEQFSELSSNVEKTFSPLTGQTADFEAGANKQFEATNANRKIVGASPLGIYGKAPNWIDFGVLTNVQFGKDPKGVVTAYSSLIVRGKLLSLQVYRAYRGEADSIWTRDRVKAWREAIMAANP